MIKTIQKNMNKKGFTLVELIIVIAVMAILAAIVVPRMSGITQSFREKADLRSCETLARELELKIQLGELGWDTSATPQAQKDEKGNVETVLAGGDLDAPRNGGDFFFTYDESEDAGTLTVFVGADADTKTNVGTDSDVENIEVVLTQVHRIE